MTNYQLNNDQLIPKVQLPIGKLKIGYLLVIGIWALVITALSGCGEIQTNNRYFYSPAWTRGGQVIFVAALETIGKDIFGSRLSYSYNEYVQTIYPSGTGESAVLFNVTGDPAYQMSCSPTADYVAYLGSLDAGLYGKITIRNIAAGQHTGLEVAQLKFSPGISSFDWSSDGTKIVYAQGNDIRMRNWNDFTSATDVLVATVTGLSSLSWQSGNRIAYATSSVTSLIYSDGSGQLNLPAAAFVSVPQVLLTNTQEVFGVSGTTFCSVDASVPSPTTTVVASSFSGVLPRLSPDGNTAVYSKSGETTGVYLLNLATGAETKLK